MKIVILTKYQQNTSPKIESTEVQLNKLKFKGEKCYVESPEDILPLYQS